jgi:hypothetical protein
MPNFLDRALLAVIVLSVAAMLFIGLAVGFTTLARWS